MGGKRGKREKRAKLVRTGHADEHFLLERARCVAFMYEWRASVQFVSEGRHDNDSEMDSTNLEKLSIINKMQWIK